MERQQLIQTLETSGIGTYKVIYKSGRKALKRLALDEHGLPMEFKPRSRTRGWLLDNLYIQSIARISKSDKGANVRSFEIFERNLRKAHKYVRESGLWPRVLKDVTNVLNLFENQRRELYELSDYVSCPVKEDHARRERMEAFRKKHDIELSTDELYSLSFPSGVKTANYEDVFQLQLVQTYIREAREGKVTTTSPDRDYTYRRHLSWRKGYDNSVSIERKNDGLLYGYYSEEYKDCGNGHYFILLDDRHVMKVEDD